MNDDDQTSPFRRGSGGRPGRGGGRDHTSSNHSSSNQDGSNAENGRNPVTVDMEAVRADDRLLDALSHNRLPGNWDSDPADEQLAALLSGWRHEIDAAPMPTGPTLEAVEGEIARVDRIDSRRSTMRRLRVVAGAASVAVVAFGAVTVLAQNSNPGDPLWSVKQAMFGSAASATVASADAQSNLEKAEQALSTGDKRQAAQYLVEAQEKVSGMSGDDARQRMQDWTQRLAEQVGPLPDNPLTSLTELPSIPGLPPIEIQISSDQISPSIPSSVLDKQKQMLDRRARGVTPTKQTPPVTTTPQVPAPSTPATSGENTTTTTTTTSTPN